MGTAFLELGNLLHQDDEDPDQKVTIDPTAKGLESSIIAESEGPPYLSKVPIRKPATPVQWTKAPAEQDEKELTKEERQKERKKQVAVSFHKKLNHMDAHAIESLFGLNGVSSEQQQVTEKQPAAMAVQSRGLVNKKKHAIFESNKRIIEMEKEFRRMYDEVLESKRCLQNEDLSNNDHRINHLLKRYLDLTRNMNLHLN